MSHFTVLTCVRLPEDVSEAMQATPAQALGLSIVERVLLAAISNGPELQTQIRSSNNAHFEAIVGQLVEKRLEPYCESPAQEEYLEFKDMTQEGKAQYETGTTDCVRMPDGRIIPTYRSPFYDLYELHEGKVYKRRYGHLHHRKRTKKAKRFLALPGYPFKKLYPSFEAFMEEYYGYYFDKGQNAYGYYFNPNAKWDWYQIGGRWPFRFLVKNECATAVSGEFSHIFRGPPNAEGPEGYRWVAGARKCDIAWDVIKEFHRTGATQQFRLYEEWMAAGEIPQEHWGYRIAEEELLCWGDLVYRKGESLDDYLRRCGLSEEFKYPIDTYAFVSEDGWEGSADMGWFGMSSNKKDELDWNHAVEEFIAALPDDAFLVSVDCHI